VPKIRIAKFAATSATAQTKPTTTPTPALNMNPPRRPSRPISDDAGSIMASVPKTVAVTGNVLNDGDGAR
jgi:hypothetical protein